MIQDTTFDEKNLGDLLKIDSKEFENCDFNGIDFSELSLKRCVIADSRLNLCNLSGRDLTGASLRDVRFTDCKLVGINWCVLNRFENCEFKDCKLDLSSFQALKLKRGKFINCSLKEVDFSEAHLSESDFSGSMLAGATFTRADLTKANLKTSKSYFIDPAFTKIKGAKFSLPDALSLFAALGVEVDY